MAAHHGRLLLTVMLAALALGGPGASARPQHGSTEALVDAVLDAYGGRAAVRAVRSYRLEGAVAALDRGETGQLTRIVVAPAALKVLIRYPSASEVRLVDGDTGQRGTTLHDLVPVQGPLLGAMVVQAARANLPWILDTRRSVLRPLESNAGGDTLELPLRDGLLLRVSLDPRSRLITRAVGLVSAGPRQIPFQTDLSDFRKVNGVLFPFHEENYASGTHTGTTTVTRVLVNPPAARLDLQDAP
jgi:hypothetical protein